MKGNKFLSISVSITLISTVSLGIFYPDKDIRTEIREWTIGLLLPSLLGFGGFWFNRQIEERSQREQQEQWEQSEIKDYFNRMSTLIRDGLTQKDEVSDDYKIARALTANILREVDKERRNQVMFFLKSLNLVGKAKTSHFTEPISLFRGIDLHEANLTGLRADNVDFSGANLYKAILDKSHLARAKFHKSTLKKASLKDSYSFSAEFIKTDLTETDLTGTVFNGASFKGAKLSRTSLSRHLSQEKQEQCAKYENIHVASKNT